MENTDKPKEIRKFRDIKYPRRQKIRQSTKKSGSKWKTGKDSHESTGNTRKRWEGHENKKKPEKTKDRESQKGVTKALEE